MSFQKRTWDERRKKSGGHGIRRRGFSQTVSPVQLVTKRPAQQGFAYFLSHMVVCGCLLLVGIVFSTFSAHSSLPVAVRERPRFPSTIGAPAITVGGSNDLPKRPRVLKTSATRAGRWRTSNGVPLPWLMLVLSSLSVLGIFTVPLCPRNPGEPLRVLVIGRISTPHQRQESIEASYEFVEQYLAKVYNGPIKVTRLGEQASGMVADRKTIREAEDLIAAGRVDLILVEDVGRIYRDPRHLIAFVSDAVDAEVRLVAINDGLDTAEDDWEIVLHLAMMRHGFAATDAKHRVRRTSTYAFHRGGDVRKLLFGYRKLNKAEAESGQFGSVGLRMARIQECTPVIQQMRKMVLAGHSYEEIADWLNRESISPGPYSKKEYWTAKLVIDLLRSKLLHGERELRKVLFQRIRKTGKYRRIKNPNPESKFHPELAHLSIEEHRELLATMDQMASERQRHKNGEHPRSRLPRSQAIWPSAMDAECSACEQPAYIFDTNQLKCSTSFVKGELQCWNHVQANREAIRLSVLPWFLAVLRESPAAWTAFLGSAWQTIERQRTGNGTALEAEIGERDRLQKEALQLGKAIAAGGNLATLVKLLDHTEAAIAATTARLLKLQEESTGELPNDPESLLQDPLPAVLELSRSSYEFGALLRRVVHLTIVPIQDIVCGQVRPRIRATAHFAPLEAGDSDPSGEIVHSASFDVFTIPKHIRYLNEVRRLLAEPSRLSQRQVAERLGIDRDTIKLVVKYLKAMERIAADQPYIELTERPANASRWRDKKTKSSGDDGKRS